MTPHKTALEIIQSNIKYMRERESTTLEAPIARRESHSGPPGSTEVPLQFRLTPQSPEAQPESHSE